MSEHKLRPGWLNRQIKKAKKDFRTWPKWMRREARIKTIAPPRASKQQGG